METLSKPVRILLFAAAFLFVVGTAWIIVLAVKNKKTKVATTPTNVTTSVPPVVSVPASPQSEPENTTPSQPVVSTPTPSKSVTVRPKTITTITYEIPDETSDSTSASASAGVNADGSTYASATAQ